MDNEGFFFARYVDGQRMAEDIQINVAATLDEAIAKAVRICPRTSRPTVLVHVPHEPALSERKKDEGEWQNGHQTTENRSTAHSAALDGQNT